MEIRKVLARPVPQRVILALIIVLPLVGLLIGFIGNYGGGSSTITVNPTITPRDIGLTAGQSRAFTILVRNPEDYGVRVASISAGSSDATEGTCPAGVLTSAEVIDPRGFIRANDVQGYPITVSLADNVEDGCLNQAIPLPLTVGLQSN